MGQENTVTCPQCGNSIPTHPSFVVWCESCEWNLDPELRTEKKRSTFLEQYIATRGAPHRERILETATKMWRSGCTVKQPYTWKVLASHVLSGVVAGVNVACIVVAVMIMITADMYAVAILVSILLIGMVFMPFVAARTDKPSGLTRVDLDLDDHPATVACIAHISRQLGMPPVNRVVLTTAYNARAHAGTFGLGRRPTVEIGYSLWGVLTTRERLAILAHELAHVAHRDLRRDRLGWYVWTVLQQWYWLVTPELFFDSSRPGAQILLFPLRMIGWLVGRAIYSVGYLQATLLMSRMQLREYLADARSVEVAGADATMSMLDKLHLRDAFESSVERYTLRADPRPPMYEFILDYFRSIPDREIERLRILMRRKLTRVDVTHPPTIDRIEFAGRIGATAVSAAADLLMQEMERELTPYADQFARSTEQSIRRMKGL